MGTYARVGVLCLMALAIALARLVEVEFRAEVKKPQPALTVGATEPAPTPNPPLDETEPEPETPPKAKGRTYVVKNGDTLGTISKRFYRTTTKWEAIYQANRDKMRNPRTMRPGTEIRIPRLEK